MSSKECIEKLSSALFWDIDKNEADPVGWAIGGTVLL